MLVSLAFVIVAFSLLVLCWIVGRWRRWKHYKLSTDLDGPRDYPLIGSAHLFLGKSTEEQFRCILDISQSYQSPCRIWLGPKLFVFIDNADDLQIVLNSANCLEKADVYRFFQCETGLFSAPANIWRVHRKHLSPCFNAKILASFVSIFNVKSAVLVDQLVPHVNKTKLFNVYEYIAKCTLDMVCATTLGTNMNLQNEQGDEYIGAIERASELLNHRLYKVWLHPEWIYRLTSYYKIQQQCYATAYKMSRRVLALKSDELAEIRNRTASKTSKPNEKQLTDEYRKPQIYIDQLFRLAKETDVFDEQAIRDEIDTIILGGNETSALTLSHVVLMLAIHQDVQQRVYEEIVTTLGGSIGEVENEHLSRLTYMEMVLKETMRLFPVGPIIARQCTEDTKISRTTIPSGVTVVLGIFNVQRSELHWGSAANSFDPDNFLPERIADRHPYCFLPFSAGPRNCIGYKYGLMSMKVMLCHLLTAYRFSTDLTMDQLTLKLDITLKIANKHMVRVVRR
ncbi:probable cytochrome P450 313b1 [Anopheles maculipalpis]|uniref:probable cytochrome P450 313b1 n=1 Tax=Anopheles maculipalpis TaxID=1496333 RepID=UPI002158DDDD|nr:probable cytochrome P450 313b1 [Anopheles maculipalpis]